MTSSVDPTSGLSLRCNIAVGGEGGDCLDIGNLPVENWPLTPAQHTGCVENTMWARYRVTMSKNMRVER